MRDRRKVLPLSWWRYTKYFLCPAQPLLHERIPESPLRGTSRPTQGTPGYFSIPKAQLTRARRFTRENGASILSLFIVRLLRGFNCRRTTPIGLMFKLILAGMVVAGYLLVVAGRIGDV